MNPYLSRLSNYNTDTDLCKPKIPVKQLSKGNVDNVDNSMNLTSNTFTELRMKMWIMWITLPSDEVITDGYYVSGTHSY